MRSVSVLTLALVSCVLVGCQVAPYEPAPRPRPQPVPSTPPPQPQPEAEPEPPKPEPPPPPTQPPRQFKLSPATAALVQQARTQASSGNGPQAIATVERALRIEPDNPLLWIELGRINQDEGRYAQAHSMGRKALTLATGDPRAQSEAWRLIADALRAQVRNQEAAEAEQRAAALTVGR